MSDLQYGGYNMLTMIMVTTPPSVLTLRLVFHA